MYNKFFAFRVSPFSTNLCIQENHSITRTEIDTELEKPIE